MLRFRHTKCFRACALAATLLLGLGLGGCGGDSSGSGSTSTQGSGGSGQFSLRLTDAPLNLSTAVVIAFTEVRLKRDDGGWAAFSLPAPKSIDLLQLQGIASEDLLSGVRPAPGDYTEIRLLVSANSADNYIELLGGARFDLRIPSGSASGLKIKGDFTISETRDTTLIADFDLLQSIVMTGGPNPYLLKPVIRLVDTSSVSHIRGMVDASLLVGPNCSDADPDTHNSLYVFAGHNAKVEDIDQDPGSDPNEATPVTTSLISLDSATGKYLYEAAYLPEGDYTIAVTCSADLEDLDSDADDLRFFNIHNVTVLVSNILFL